MSGSEAKHPKLITTSISCCVSWRLLAILFQNSGFISRNDVFVEPGPASFQSRMQTCVCGAAAMEVTVQVPVQKYLKAGMKRSQNVRLCEPRHM